MPLAKKDKNLCAVLGPTNTGKTYYAFDRLISYNSGIFGFPLRLLARENYDKAVKILGARKVALITGEEKIYPKDASYFFCTVESMPLNLNVDCVVIDEVQLASDYERGHIFTDRILNLRGMFETIFLGSLTIKKILKKLFPKIKILSRDRFSQLLFLHKPNIIRLKPQSAIIAFNINKVYEIAEMLRMHKGGAAVILGSLSPRTRNAQVDIYENKKVDYLVATDAIGMGLNLNINHISFSSLQKFDGRYNRNLYPSELGQIAGRAGRYQKDGTFGFAREASKIDSNIIQLIEDNNFQEINKIYWRNSEIDFSSVSSVLNSLKQFPVLNFFILKKNAEDESSFRVLSNDQDLIIYLNNKFNIKLLWDICRIPDFQKIMNDNYINLLKSIFLTLMSNNLKIPEKWIIEKMIRIDNYTGGIEELSSKIASIRTWTYIANQSNWFENNDYWKEKTRKIEDNLSDHLHTSLTNRFIDFSASYFVNAKNNGDKPLIEIDTNKCIKLDGQNYGYINGFDLELFEIFKSKSLFFHNHVKKSIRKMIEEKIMNFINAPDDSINLGDIQKLNLEEKPYLYWGDEKIGFLKKGDKIYSPKVEIFNSEFLESDKKVLVIAKLQRWIDEKISVTLKPIKDNIDNIPSVVRSIAYNLFNLLGTMTTDNYQDDIKNFLDEDKIALSKLNIRMGVKFFFIPNYLKKNAMELNAILWNTFNDHSYKGLYPLPKDGRVSFDSNVSLPLTYWQSIGYVCLNDFAVRVDVFERIFFLARQKLKSGPFLESSDLMNPIGCNSLQLANILSFCGFQNISITDHKKLYFAKKDYEKKSKKVIKKKRIAIKLKNKKKSSTVRKVKTDPNSPFAVLQKLL